MKKIKTIQDIFDHLCPYLIRIELDQEQLTEDKALYCISMMFPQTWTIITNEDFQAIQKFDDEYNVPINKFYITNHNKTINDLVQYIIEIVNDNIKKEEQEEKIRQKIKKEEEKFRNKIEQIKNSTSINDNKEIETPLIKQEQLSVEQKIEEPETSPISENTNLKDKKISKPKQIVYPTNPINSGGVMLMRDIKAENEGTEEDYAG